MFIKKYELRFSDMDEFRNIKISAILDILQDVSIAHADSVGLTADKLSKRETACLLGGWRILLNSPLEKSEILTVKTGFMEFTKCEAIRMYEIWQNNECKIKATGIWFVADTKIRRIIRIPEDFKAAFGCVKEPENNILFIKPKAGSDLALLGEIEVTRREMDSNKHMNNMKSVEAALSFFSERYNLKELQVRYRKEIKFGEHLRIFGNETENDFYAEIRNSDKKQCVLVFGIKN